MTDRKGQLSELKQSGIEMGIKLQNILDSLGWNKQNTVKYTTNYHITLVVVHRWAYKCTYTT